MLKADILTEERIRGTRLVHLRRQYNLSLAAGGKQVHVTSGRNKTNVTVERGLEQAAFQKAVGAKGAIWTHNNLQVTTTTPALGPWITINALLGLSNPRIHV